MTFRISPASVASQHKSETVRWSVKAVLTGAVPVAKLAQDMGIGQATIRRWVRDAIDQSPYHDAFEALAEEVERLRRENADLKKIVVGRKPRLAAAGSRPKEAAPVPREAPPEVAELTAHFIAAE